VAPAKPGHQVMRSRGHLGKRKKNKNFRRRATAAAKGRPPEGVFNAIMAADEHHRGRLRVENKAFTSRLRAWAVPSGWRQKKIGFPPVSGRVRKTCLAWHQHEPDGNQKKEVP